MNLKKLYAGGLSFDTLVGAGDESECADFGCGFIFKWVWSIFTLSFL